MAFVFKIKYEDSLRRLTVPKTSTGAPDMSFAKLDAKIREYFRIPVDSKIVVTYTDGDNDVVTMTEDQELHDACVLQGINPLRLDVSAVPPCEVVSVSLEGLDPNVDSVREILGKLGLSQKAITDIVEVIMKPCAQRHAEPAATKELETELIQQNQSRNEVFCSGPKGVFHHNIQCDGCGLSPIVGPRFKSMLKDDYDLCLSCFNTLPKGLETDYVRYDRPVQRSRYFPLLGGRMGRCPAKPYLPHRVYCPRTSTFVYDRAGFPASLKPDGRFVCDVTIADGTELAPCASFVKIWRLRNSGKVPWEQNTQLVRVGGDELGSVSSVTLEKHAGGVTPNAEIEVAVDMVAPEKPGRYVSYWRLMSPSGLKFGHRVWSLIQVVPKAVNLNALEKDYTTVPNMEAVANNEDLDLEEANIDGAVLVEIDDAVSVEPVVDVHPAEQESPVEKTDVGGFSMVEMPDSGAKPAGDKQESVSDESVIEGFDHIELLQKNEQRSLDDLFLTLEWKTRMEELEEMGFHDVETNRGLMSKHNGSLKRVVKELVQMYKEPAKEVV